MFFEPLCKGSRGFTNVFLITVNPATLKSIDDPTLFEDWIFILWGHQEAFDGSTSFEVHLYTMFITGLFKALTDPLVIGYYISIHNNIMDKNPMVYQNLQGKHFLQT